MGLLAAAWGAASWCQTPAQQHRLIDAAPQEAGLVVARNASCIYLGIGAGTFLSGITISAGATSVYFLGAALATASLAYLRATTRRRALTEKRGRGASLLEKAAVAQGGTAPGKPLCAALRGFLVYRVGGIDSFTSRQGEG
ncbi:hypothetical protein [Streptomyces sp. 8K308]|uniref:hypothetical protein n=1 Tax=Streptomyces sp. 8K308 TaxID=2530388 RepID=UPI001FB78BA9|nr:hypothetical protein [Streptomyces sp. 8K308]